MVSSLISKYKLMTVQDYLQIDKIIHSLIIANYIYYVKFDCTFIEIFGLT